MKQKKFNPDLNVHNGIFGLPFTQSDSLVHILPVPWDATSSYGVGSHKAPEFILKESVQVDLYKEFYPEYVQYGIYMHPISSKIAQLNKKIRPVAEGVMEAFYKSSKRKQLSNDVKKVNDASAEVNNYVCELSKRLLEDGRVPVVLGGDHSCAYGLIKVLSERDRSFGILQIDAHADLRQEYQGFQYSHASIMYEVMQFEKIEKIVQVGIRDYCYEEEERIRNNEHKLISYTSRFIHHRLFEGLTWQKITEEIVSRLPRNVYVSIDIDGLDCAYCPCTGTPVPGGLLPEQVKYLLEMICLSGRKIIGADLTEVIPSKQNRYDVIVGVHLLLELCMHIIYSNVEQRDE